MKKIKLNRGVYGQLIELSKTDKVPVVCRRGADILSLAIKKDLLDAEFCEVDAKHRGSALNYDIYDVAPGQVLVQQRFTVCTKYGNNPKKNYFLLRRVGKKISVIDVEFAKSIIVKTAKKHGDDAGVVIKKVNSMALAQALGITPTYARRSA